MKKNDTRKWCSCPPGLTVYKPLPEGWKESRHYYFYGWAVTPEMLLNYLVKHKLGNQYDVFSSAGIVAYHLECRSGYHHVNIVQGNLEGLPPDRQSRVTQSEFGPVLRILSISCTRAKEFFYRRPTVAQLKKLEELLGEPPSWFEDHWTKEEFDMTSVS